MKRCSANDVTFTTGSAVDASNFLHVAGGVDLPGWYNVSVPSTIFRLNSTATQVGDFTLSPSGVFGLVGRNTSPNYEFYSQSSAGGNADAVSHFAYFTDRTLPARDALEINATPEPGSILPALSQ